MLTPDVVQMLLEGAAKAMNPSNPDLKPLIQKALVQLAALSESFKDDGPESQLHPSSVKRTIFLSFTEHSKTISVATKKPAGGSGKVSVEVTINIPTALFHSTKLKATVNLPSGGLSQEALVDVKDALTMAYGNKVELLVQAVENAVVS